MAANLQTADRQALLDLLARPPQRVKHPYRVSWAEVQAARRAEVQRLIEVGPSAPLPWSPEELRIHPAGTCSIHRQYHLTCGEAEMLYGEAGGFCDICRIDTERLNVDHDHAVGRRAVRGLVCQSCNAFLAAVDVGARIPSRDIANYLGDPWYARVGLDSLGCPASCATDHGVRPNTRRYKPELATAPYIRSGYGRWARIPSGATFDFD